MRKIRPITLNIALIGVGSVVVAALFGLSSNSVDSQLAQVCGELVSEEEFLHICPHAANLRGFIFLPMGSRVRDTYKCTLTIFDSGRFGIPIVIDRMATPEEARTRLKEQATRGYPQKRGDVLGLKEPSVLTDKYDTWWLTFIKDSVFVEMVRENPEMCSEGEFLELGRLLYKRLDNLPTGGIL